MGSRAHIGAAVASVVTAMVLGACSGSEPAVPVATASTVTTATVAVTVTSTTTTSPSTTASTLDETDQTIVSASPVVLRAGEPIVLTFRPRDRIRAGHLLLYGARDTPGTVRPLFVLQAVAVGASDPGNADDLRGLAPGAYYTVPLNGRIDPDGDRVFMPDDLEPGDYKLCNSNPPPPCVAVTIVE